MSEFDQLIPAFWAGTDCEQGEFYISPGDDEVWLCVSVSDGLGQGLIKRRNDELSFASHLATVEPLNRVCGALNIPLSFACHQTVTRLYQLEVIDPWGVHTRVHYGVWHQITRFMAPPI